MTPLQPGCSELGMSQRSMLGHRSGRGSVERCSLWYKIECGGLGKAKHKGSSKTPCKLGEQRSDTCLRQGSKPSSYQKKWWGKQRSRGWKDTYTHTYTQTRTHTRTHMQMLTWMVPLPYQLLCPRIQMLLPLSQIWELTTELGSLIFIQQHLWICPMDPQWPLSLPRPG